MPGTNRCHPPVSIAPMMDRTDRHYRYFMRQMTRHTLLYTEMKTTGAVLFGDREKILGYSDIEKPLALQLGGDDPKALAESARIAESMDYDEVNLNVGCPSERVQKGNFGAGLMAHPDVVAECISAMRQAVSIPVTVKHRIGIDGREDYEDLAHFVEVVSRAGCRQFIVHARIAILQGLDPKQNRSIPPLRYDDVYRLKSDFPHLCIIINGGIKTPEEMQEHLTRVDGVMIGRAAYENPFLFAGVDSLFFGDNRPAPTRRQVIEAMAAYIDQQRERGIYPNRITRHLLGLFANRPGARTWKRYLSEHAHLPEASGKILIEATRNIPEDILEEPSPLYRGEHPMIKAMPTT